MSQDLYSQACSSDSGIDPTYKASDDETPSTNDDAIAVSKPSEHIKKQPVPSCSKPRTFEESKENNSESSSNTDTLYLIQLEKTLLEQINSSKEYALQDTRKKKISYVLENLQSIGTIWISSLAKKRKYLSHATGEVQCKIYPCGSYKLGVSFADSEVEAMFVAPRFVERGDFFTEFRAVLQKLSHVEHLRVVHVGYHPQMKMKLFGVNVTLSFIKLFHPVVDNKEVLGSPQSKSLRRKMDPRDTQGLKEILTSQELMSSLPKPTLFVRVLQVILLWARRRGLLGERQGFLSPISWALMVAKVLQMHAPPCAPGQQTSSEPSDGQAILPSDGEIVRLVGEFFRVMSRWEWPRPLILCGRDKRYATAGLHWRPALASEVASERQFYLMPVILPGHLALNTTVGLTRSAASIIVRELAHADKLIQPLLENKEAPASKCWDSLFTPLDFFVFRHYLVVEVTHPSPVTDSNPATTPSTVTPTQTTQFLENCEVAEHALGSLCHRLDKDPSIELAPCFSVPQGSIVGPGQTQRWFVGLQWRRKAAGEPVRVDISGHLDAFPQLVSQASGNRRLLAHNPLIKISYLKKRDLGQYMSPADLSVARATTCQFLPYIQVTLRSFQSPDHTSESHDESRTSVCLDWCDPSGDADTPVTSPQPTGSRPRLISGSETAGSTSVAATLARKRSISSSCGGEEDDVFSSQTSATSTKRLSSSTTDDKPTLNRSSSSGGRVSGPAWLTEECRLAAQRKQDTRALWLKNKSDEEAKEAYILAEYLLKQAIIEARREWKEAQVCGVILSLVPSSSASPESGSHIGIRRLSSTSSVTMDIASNDITLENLRCLSSSQSSSSSLPGVVAIECRMVGVGPQNTSVLGRVSIVATDGRVLHDGCSRSNEPINDYRTRTTGLKPFHIKNALPFHHVQEKVRGIIQGNILVGHNVSHSLEMLRLNHPREHIRDTAHCFHLRCRAGLPLEAVDVGLTSLAALLLDRAIQHGTDVCCVEGARATMDLYQLVRDDWESDLLLSTQKRELITSDKV